MKTLKEIYEYREMIFSLVHRDIRGKYKGSVLGIFWSLLNPLLQLIVYTIVFSVIMRAGYDKYYLFLFVALVPWLFFNLSVSAGSTVIWNQKELVNKIYFPREVLPIAHVTAQLVNMLLSFIVIFLVVIVTGHGINLKAILFLPIIIVIEYLMALGFTFLSSSITIFFRDFEFILAVFMMAWQFLSPVMYGVDMVPEQLRPIFMMNPLTPILMVYRDIIYSKVVPDMKNLATSAIFALVIFAIGAIVFGSLKKKFSEEM
ncbi:ABC-2 type transport system permease protein [Butyrivibrio proteoclasticus]|uniref:Transport permease protein n=1 Tax=Butyrivibrio proteoclasticus TaxID=43305 RepID=A0A1I5PUP3_9FIRM|nr:ABC transporter permease [Butyrivibrio proteoclasticus]SFP37346.1 ABC-2 type transport system permease protein [Butyrivibrio proteoclasticus]